MLLEGTNGAGKLTSVRVDDDGKLIISGVVIDGDFTIGAEVEINNGSDNPVPVSTSTPARTNPPKLRLRGLISKVYWP